MCVNNLSKLFFFTIKIKKNTCIIQPITATQLKVANIFCYYYVRF